MATSGRRLPSYDWLLHFQSQNVQGDPGWCIKPSRQARPFVVRTHGEGDDRAFFAEAGLAQVPRIAFPIEALRENDVSVGNNSVAEGRINPRM